ncbi:MAG: imidazole glycerol phosphate synthase subunit HisF [Bacteroidota bacterium]|jgi:cyclase|nr:imidazole glycerol phosphate synthase subunit HisF [Bacteroidota bacterium]MCA6442015.1 imidazole glycerol phosphate synthase subunit HisF [Bacteroidota bacterium]
MIATRIIPRLDIKGPNLVKGIHLEGLRVLGDPSEFAKFYYEQGADELIYQDVVASLFERNSLHDIISKTAKQVFIPITVGGGLRSIEDIKQVLRAGADKVSLNTAAIKNPQLIKEASLKFGSSTIVVAIEAIKQSDGTYHAYIDNGREETGMEVARWAKQVEELGAGEINLTSVDRDGTGLGFDLELIKMVTDLVSIPVIAHGGPGNINHTAEAVTKGNAHAVSLASVLHYDAIKHNFNLEKVNEGNFEFLKANRNYSKISPCNLEEIKTHFKKEGLVVR